MKHRILAVSFSALFAFVACVAAEPARTGVCHATNVNVRAGHGPDFQKFPVLYTITQGDRIDVLAEEGDWVKISSPKAPSGKAETEQWVMKKFITLDQLPPDTAPPATRPVPTHFWATREEGETLVDIVDPVDGIDLQKLAETYPPKQGRYTPIPASEPGLPKRFHVGDRLPLVTAKGLEMRPLKGFGIGPGASEIHFYLVLDTPPEAPDCGVLLPTAASSPARLRSPETVELPAETREALYNTLREGMNRLAGTIRNEGETPEGIRETIATVTFNPESIRLLRGAFPITGAYLAAADFLIQDKERLGFLALVSPKGEILEPIALSGFYGYEVRYLADLDSDGFDEIVFAVNAYEGQTIELISWKAGKAVRESMTGDGA